MAATSDRLDPLASFNFIVDIQGMRAGFSEIGGLSTETDIIEYREGNEDITMRKLPGKRKYANITLNQWADAALFRNHNTAQRISSACAGVEVLRCMAKQMGGTGFQRQEQ
jgi:phage tail-like protein